MAEILTSTVEGRLVLAPRGRDITAVDGRRQGVRYGTEHEQFIPDPRSWPDSAVLPPLAVACHRHDDQPVRIDPRDLLPHLANRQSRNKPVVMVPSR